MTQQTVETRADHGASPGPRPAVAPGDSSPWFPVDCRGWKKAWTTFGFAAVIGLALALVPPAAGRTAGPGEFLEEEARREEMWRGRHQEMWRAVEDARRKMDDAQEANRGMGHRRSWRGVHRTKILKGLEDTQAALKEAEQALEHLYEEARRACVPPGWVRPPD